MTLIDQIIQGGNDMPTYVLKCYCGEPSYLTITQDPDDHEYYIHITLAPTRWWGRHGRLDLAWKALRGIEFSGSNEVIILEEDANKLIEALTMKKPGGS